MVLILSLLIVAGTLMTLFSMAKVAGKADEDLERIFNESYNKRYCESGGSVVSNTF